MNAARFGDTSDRELRRLARLALRDLEHMLEELERRRVQNDVAGLTPAERRAGFYVMAGER